MTVRLKKRTFNGHSEILRKSGKALSLSAFVYLLCQLRVLRGLRRGGGDGGAGISRPLERVLAEHPRDGGWLRRRARGDGNVAVVRFVERLFDDAVAVGVQDQVVHHADAQPALDHREDGKVAADLKLDARGTN